jgi:hypothetical protein
MTPVGGVIAGVVMSRWGKLAHLVRVGAALMFFGNLLVTFLNFNDSNWKYFAYIIPANLGQGIVYPGILFTFLSAFDHDGTLLPTPHPNQTPWLTISPIRSRRFSLNSLPNSLPGNSLGRRNNVRNNPKYTELRPRRGLEWSTRQMESTIQSSQKQGDRSNFTERRQLTPYLFPI